MSLSSGTTVGITGPANPMEGPWEQKLLDQIYHLDHQLGPLPAAKIPLSGQRLTFMCYYFSSVFSFKAFACGNR